MKFRGAIFLIWQNITMRVYGAWIRIYYDLCSNTAPLAIGLYHLQVRDEPLGVPAFTRLTIELKLLPLFGFHLAYLSVDG